MTGMNHTRILYRVCLALSLAAFFASAVLAVLTQVTFAFVVGLVGACTALTAAHLQLRIVLSSQRALHRALTTMSRNAALPGRVGVSSPDVDQTLSEFRDRLTAMDEKVTQSAEYSRLGLRALYTELDSLSCSFRAFEGRAAGRADRPVDQGGTSPAQLAPESNTRR